MIGGTVSQVINSNIDGFAPGDFVLSFNGWQDYAVSDGTGLTNLGKSSTHLSCKRYIPSFNLTPYML
jgi:NADPH-dependent curcumin reductase CurA